MKTTRSFVAALLVLVLVFEALPKAEASAQPAPDGAEHVYPAQLVTVSRHGSVETARGALVTNAAKGSMLFRRDGRTLLTVAFRNIVALHSEQSKYPRRPWGRSGRYLAIHFLAEDGQVRSAVVALNGRKGEHTLAALEIDTGVRIDISDPTKSFLGLPIYLAPEDLVFATDRRFRRIKGKVVQVSASSLRVAVLDGAAAGMLDLDASSVSRIELGHLGFSEARWAPVGTAAGLLIAVPIALQMAFGGSTTNPNLVLGGLSAAGGALGYVADRQRTRVVYQDR
jgi:hypothetical protein